MWTSVMVVVGVVLWVPQTTGCGTKGHRLRVPSRGYWLHPEGYGFLSKVLGSVPKVIGSIPSACDLAVSTHEREINEFYILGYKFLFCFPFLSV